MKRLVGMVLLAGASLAHAQNQSIPNAPASAAKKDLIQHLVVLQQPALDSMARNVAERPARQMMADAGNALQTNVAPDKRQAVAAQIEGHLRKYLDEALPVARDRASKVGQTSLGPLLEEKFSEDELRQLLATLEAPAYKKFQQALPDLTTAFVQKLIADIEPTLEPKLKVLERNVGAALGVPGSAASGPMVTKPAAPAASKPAKK